MISFLLLFSGVSTGETQGLALLHKIPSVDELGWLGAGRRSEELPKLLRQVDFRIRQFSRLPKMVQRHSLHVFAEECLQKIVNVNGGKVPTPKQWPQYMTGPPDFGTAEVLAIYKGKKPALIALQCQYSFLSCSDGHLKVDPTEIAQSGPCVPTSISSYYLVKKGEELISSGYYDLTPAKQTRTLSSQQPLCKFNVTPLMHQGLLVGFNFSVVNLGKKTIRVVVPSLGLGVGYETFNWPRNVPRTLDKNRFMVQTKAYSLKAREKVTGECDIDQIAEELPVGKTIGVRFIYDDVNFNSLAERRGSTERSDVRKAIPGPTFWFKRERAGVRLLSGHFRIKVKDS